MKIKSLTELLEANIKSLYDIENQILATLPELIKQADSEPLKKALADHLVVTKEQIQRINDISKQNNVQLDGKADEGIRNILKEGQMIVSQIDDPKVRDSAIMAGTEKVEYYEIAAYQTAKTLADKLKMTDVSNMFADTLKEEKRAAQSINMMANDGLLGKLSQALD